jgi:hypothetical protein
MEVLLLFPNIIDLILLLLFRVEVYGASGGIMPGQIINNRGGAVIANVFFPAGSELSTVVGQRGLCPCDLCFAKQSCHENYQQQTVGIPLSYQQKWKRICTALEQMTGTTSRILSDSVEILGCGGGGASVLLLNSAPLMVAGGGGGSFMFDGNDIPGLRMRAEGGTLIEPQAIPEKSSHVSGNGVSISSKKNSNSSSEISDGGGKMECDDCTEMSGRRILDGTLAAGICPESRQWNLTGGHGGGGARLAV